MAQPIRTIGVVGGGAWGTALAVTARRAGRDVTLWARDGATAAALSRHRQNPQYLPGITLDPAFSATTDLARLSGSDMILLATPAQTTRSLAAILAGIVPSATPVVLCAKGIERDSGLLLADVLLEEMPEAVPAVLSGPSFATDVARGLPTAVTIAADDAALADRLARSLSSAAFRPYVSTDLKGVLLCGALKNVLAIAAGIVVGRGLGASAQAALIARGFAELTRLGTGLGARSETLTGLAGLGDLVLTCSTAQSRNFAFGEALGKGRTLGQLLRPGHKLAEGALTAEVAVTLAGKHSIELPISEAVAAILAGTLTIDAALERLMSRPLRRETD